MAQPRAATDMPLDRNESYWLLDDELLSACKEYGVRELSTYPDYGELRIELARYANVTPEQICLTPGSDAAIESIARELVGKDGEVVLPVPTFYGYESILDRASSTIRPITYTEKDGQFHFPKEELLRKIESESIKAVFLCNPNNPLGHAASKEEVMEVIDALRPSTYLISDEAYFEYSGFTLIDLLNRVPNLIIMRTLSKSFGIPGARIGYCIAAPEIISHIEKLLLPWPIAHTSYFAARQLLAREQYVKERRDMVIQARDAFVDALKEIEGIQVYPSVTNFVLMRTPKAEQVTSALSRKGIKVVLAEPMSRFPEAQKLLHSTIRMAIPSPQDMPIFLDTFRASLQDT
ncbi:MAG: histidinol-phosphate transaminase [Candidatus Pacebacteria bacterium]|nr:histidinol-phosphate transaminase [Candidatus Paceibacterota bacterium]